MLTSPPGPPAGRRDGGCPGEVAAGRRPQRRGRRRPGTPDHAGTGQPEVVAGSACFASTGDVRVVPAAEWDGVVRALGGLDTYTRAAYHGVSALLEPAGTRSALLHYTGGDRELALPLLLRPLPDGGGWDATSAYGYGGPVGQPGGRPAEFGAALDGWARKNAVVTTFLRLHPLLGNGPLVPPSAERIELGRTVAWNVSAGRDLTALMHAHHRRAARRAERAGLVVDVVLRPRSLAEFRDLYSTTMRRQQAQPFFFFADSYWEALVDSADALGLVLVEGRQGGQLVAALLCFAEGPWLHYHLGASDGIGRTIGASHRCFVVAAEWAQSRGMTHFHLGGGVGSSTDSPLFTFKSRFDPGSPLLSFSVAKLVHDRVRYRQLAGVDTTAGFFPRWRRGG